MTTHRRVAEYMNLPCRCPRQYKHAVCEGDMTRKTAYYTPEYVNRFLAAIKYEMTQSQLAEELQGSNHRLPRMFGAGSMCYCKEVHVHGVRMTCGSCHVEPMENTCEHETNGETSGLSQRHEVFVHEGSTGNSLSDGMLQKQLYLLHSATGHCSVRNMIVALQKRGASQRVLDAAKKFTCAACAERQKLNTKHVASLEALPPKWATVCADGGTWTHVGTKETVGFAVFD